MMSELQVFAGCLGLFSIAVAAWDGVITLIEVEKHGLQQEVNPIAKLWMQGMGAIGGILATRLFLIAFVLYVVLFLSQQKELLALTLLTGLAIAEGFVVGWHVSADFHVKEFRKELKVRGAVP